MSSETIFEGKMSPIEGMTVLEAEVAMPDAQDPNEAVALVPMTPVLEVDPKRVIRRGHKLRREAAKLMDSLYPRTVQPMRIASFVSSTYGNGGLSTIYKQPAAKEVQLPGEPSRPPEWNTDADADAPSMDVIGHLGDDVITIKTENIEPNCCARKTSHKIVPMDFKIREAEAADDLYNVVEDEKGRSYFAMEISETRAADDGEDWCLVRTTTRGVNIVIQRCNLHPALLLFRAASTGALDEVREVLGETTRSCTDVYKNTPLHLAAQHGHVDVVRYLLEHGDRAALTACNKSNQTPLHMAVNHAAVFEVLLMQPELNFNARDTQGRTVLAQAAIQGKPDIVKLCHRAGMDVNFATGTDRRTTLHLAARNGHIAVVQFLLSCPEINVKALDDARDTPLHVAVASNQMAIAEAILAADKSATLCKNRAGQTPADLASGRLKYLIQEAARDQPSGSRSRPPAKRAKKNTGLFASALSAEDAAHLSDHEASKLVPSSLYRSSTRQSPEPPRSRPRVPPRLKPAPTSKATPAPQPSQPIPQPAVSRKIKAPRSQPTPKSSSTSAAAEDERPAKKPHLSSRSSRSTVGATARSTAPDAPSKSPIGAAARSRIGAAGTARCAGGARSSAGSVLRSPPLAATRAAANTPAEAPAVKAVGPRGARAPLGAAPRPRVGAAVPRQGTAAQRRGRGTQQQPVSAVRTLARLRAGKIRAAIGNPGVRSKLRQQPPVTRSASGSTGPTAAGSLAGPTLRLRRPRPDLPPLTKRIQRPKPKPRLSQPPSTAYRSAAAPPRSSALGPDPPPLYSTNVRGGSCDSAWWERSTNGEGCSQGAVWPMGAFARTAGMVPAISAGYGSGAASLTFLRPMVSPLTAASPMGSILAVRDLHAPILQGPGAPQTHGSPSDTESDEETDGMLRGGRRSLSERDAASRPGSGVSDKAGPGRGKVEADVELSGRPPYLSGTDSRMDAERRLAAWAGPLLIRSPLLIENHREPPRKEISIRAVGATRGVAIKCPLTLPGLLVLASQKLKIAVEEIWNKNGDTVEEIETILDGNGEIYLGATQADIERARAPSH